MIERCDPLPDGGKRVAISALAPLPIEKATLFATQGGDSWEASVWTPIAARPAGTNRHQAIIPQSLIGGKGAWQVNVSDARPVTAGSLVYGTRASGKGLAMRALGVVP